jgi:hypothetical protein
MSISGLASLLMAQMTPRELATCAPDSAAAEPTTPVYPKRSAFPDDTDARATFHEFLFMASPTEEGAGEPADDGDGSGAAAEGSEAVGRPKRWAARSTAAGLTPTPVKPERVGSHAASAATSSPAWPFAMW